MTHHTFIPAFALPKRLIFRSLCSLRIIMEIDS